MPPHIIDIHSLRRALVRSRRLLAHGVAKQTMQPASSLLLERKCQQCERLLRAAQLFLTMPHLALLTCSINCSRCCTMKGTPLHEQPRLLAHSGVMYPSEMKTRTRAAYTASRFLTFGAFPSWCFSPNVWSMPRHGVVRGRSANKPAVARSRTSRSRFSAHRTLRGSPNMRRSSAFSASQFGSCTRKAASYYGTDQYAPFHSLGHRASMRSGRRT